MAKSQIESHRLATYNLGEKGVVITKSPVHGEDGELALAQNAVPNPEGGLQGIRKRIGFRALNVTAAAGGILAFISCNLEDPGVIAVNPAAFGKWLYSTNGGTTWTYLEVQQTVDAADIPANYDGFDRLAFLHLTEDTDKTGLVAIDQVAGVNAWAASNVPAAGDDPGRVPYTIQHALDLGDGYLYYVAADGLSVRRWTADEDTELCDLSAVITGIVDWDTDGTNLWLLTTVNIGGGTPDNQQVYKITVSNGTAAKVGTVLAASGGTWDGVTAWNRVYYSLAVIKLNGTTPTVVIGGYEWVIDTYTSEHTQQAHVVKLDGSASDATAPTVILTSYDTKDVPTGHANATLTAQSLLSSPPSSFSTGTQPTTVQFAVGDTITIGDITYTAVEKATLANNTPYQFFRGGVWATESIYHPPGIVLAPIGWTGSNPGTTEYRYTYVGGLTGLLYAIYGNSAGGYCTASTPAHPLVSASGGDRTITVTARASGTSGNGITVSETSSIASWSGTTLSGGVYTVQAKANRLRVTDIINDATIGALYCAVSSNGGHSEIKKIVYPIIAGAWTASWADVRSQLYPFGYVSVWADDNVLLFLETPEAISLQLSKGVKVGTTVFYLIGTGLSTSADINLIALASGALQRIELP